MSEPSFARILILGRPNVGKSTLFNRLTKSSDAICHDRPGVTRDCQERVREFFWSGKQYQIAWVDSGGLTDEGDFTQKIWERVRLTLKDCQFALLVMDARVGVTPEDRRLVNWLRKENVPFFVLANKCDDPRKLYQLSDCYQLGVDCIFPLSAAHGRGMEELLDELVAQVPFSRLEREEKRSRIRVGIFGRPNVGKSTLFNQLLGREKTLTSEIAGTTRDVVKDEFSFRGRRIEILDTAGIRKKMKIQDPVEIFSVLKARRALEKIDVALLLLDAQEGLQDQDEKIFRLLEQEGCGVVLVLNKWDLMRRKSFTRKQAVEWIHSKAPFMKHLPLSFLSAKRGVGTRDLLKQVVNVSEGIDQPVSTSDVNRLFDSQTDALPRGLKVYYGHLVSKRPVKFLLHVNRSKAIHPSVRAQLENRLRSRFGFWGYPINVDFTKH